MSFVKSLKNMWLGFRGKPSVELQEFIEFCKKRGSFRSIEDCREYLELCRKLKALSGKE